MYNLANIHPGHANTLINNSRWHSSSYLHKQKNGEQSLTLKFTFLGKGGERFLLPLAVSNLKTHLSPQNLDAIFTLEFGQALLYRFCFWFFKRMLSQNQLSGLHFHECRNEARHRCVRASNFIFSRRSG